VFTMYYQGASLLAAGSDEVAVDLHGRMAVKYERVAVYLYSSCLSWLDLSLLST